MGGREGDHHCPFPAASLDAPPRWLAGGHLPCSNPCELRGRGRKWPQGPAHESARARGEAGRIVLLCRSRWVLGLRANRPGRSLPAPPSQRHLCLPGSRRPPPAASTIVPLSWFSSTSLGWDSPVHLPTEQEGNWVGKVCTGARASEAGLAPGRRLPTRTWCPCLAWHRASGVPGSPKPGKQCFFSRLGSPRACSAAAC